MAAVESTVLHPLLLLLHCPLPAPAPLLGPIPETDLELVLYVIVPELVSYVTAIADMGRLLRRKAVQLRCVCGTFFLFFFFFCD